MKVELCWLIITDRFSTSYGNFHYYCMRLRSEGNFAKATWVCFLLLIDELTIWSQIFVADLFWHLHFYAGWILTQVLTWSIWKRSMERATVCIFHVLSTLHHFWLLSLVGNKVPLCKLKAGAHLLVSYLPLFSFECDWQLTSSYHIHTLTNCNSLLIHLQMLYSRRDTMPYLSPAFQQSWWLLSPSPEGAWYEAWYTQLFEVSNVFPHMPDLSECLHWSCSSEGALYSWSWCWFS